jgi:tetratricopeptide (TPR) repeat protein
VLAFGNALKVLTRERAPLAWANAQMNLGNALLGLGEQEGRSGRVEEAVAAYRQSLEVFTRDRDGQAWSLAKMNLANALASLGERDKSAHSRLDEAVAAYREALEVLSREATPMRWAVTQMNLGTVLIRIGERTDRRRNWLAAAAAMVPALEVFETTGAKDYAALTRRNLKRFHEQWDSLIGGDDQPLVANDDGKRV